MGEETIWDRAEKAASAAAKAARESVPQKNVASAYMRAYEEVFIQHGRELAAEAIEENFGAKKVAMTMAEMLGVIKLAEIARGNSGQESGSE